MNLLCQGAGGLGGQDWVGMCRTFVVAVAAALLVVGGVVVFDPWAVRSWADPDR
jgi:hypothetical protein